MGALIGAAVGGVAGGLAGHGVAESVNPTEEDAYWRENYSRRPYAADRSYDDLAPAYRYGWESRARYADRDWQDVESDLQYGWEQAKGKSQLAWSDAKPAAKDAWHNAERTLFRGVTVGGKIGSFSSGYSGLAGHTGLARPALAVRLPELHDYETGRLDAAKVADYLRISLKQLSESLGRNYSTVHRTPAASAIQEPLRSIKRTLEILEQVFVDRSAVLAWLNSPHPDLDRRTPLQVILEGYPDAVEDMLEGALTGTSS